MSDTITASFSFSIGEENAKELGSASAEIDTRNTNEGGDNATRLGKTSNFEPGEAIAFLIYLPSTLKVSYIKNTLEDIIGSAITGGKSTNVPVANEQINFETRSSTGNLSKIASGITGQWVGNNLGNLTLDSDGITLLLPELPDIDKIKDGDSQTAIDKKTQSIRTPGIYIANYSTTALLYRLSTPTKKTMSDLFGKPPYPINIIIYLEPKET